MSAVEHMLSSGVDSSFELSKVLSMEGVVLARGFAVLDFGFAAGLVLRAGWRFATVVTGRGMPGFGVFLLAAQRS